MNSLWGIPLPLFIPAAIIIGFVLGAIILHRPLDKMIGLIKAEFTSPTGIISCVLAVMLGCIFSFESVLNFLWCVFGPSLKPNAVFAGSSAHDSGAGLGIIALVIMFNLVVVDSKRSA